MTIWRAACWLMGHVWFYRRGYRICADCEKVEQLPTGPKEGEGG